MVARMKDRYRARGKEKALSKVTPPTTPEDVKREDEKTPARRAARDPQAKHNRGNETPAPHRIRTAMNPEQPTSLAWENAQNTGRNRVSQSTDRRERALMKTMKEEEQKEGGWGREEGRASSFSRGKEGTF